MSEEQSKYEIHFGGGRDDSAWEAKTTICADNISDVVEKFERQYEGSCSGWGSIAVTAIVRID